MSARLFESFSGMIDTIPAKGISRAVELERGMVEDDLQHERISSTNDVVSILSFCRFIKAVSHGNAIPPVVLPISHVAFYRKIVMQLIEIGELPHAAIGQFDFSFSSGFLQALEAF
jgi:hypothetical protein